MSISELRPRPPLSEEEWRFRYGRRPVLSTDADGCRQLDYVPLTFEQWLHPDEGDEFTVTDRHQRRIHYLWYGLEAGLLPRPDALVLCDINIHWQNPALPRNHRPDLMVLFGIQNWHQGASYFVGTDGPVPTLIVEVTSESTRDGDIDIKRGHYGRARVPWYLVVDEAARTAADDLPLQLYGLTARGLEPVAPNEPGRFWLPELSLWIGSAEGRAICYHADGTEIADQLTHYQAWQAARAEAAAERQRHEARAAALAEEAQRRRAAEAVLAEEAQRRQAAEARLAQLEAEVRRLRGEAGSQ